MRRVNREHPELAGGMHLDRYARVTALADAPDTGSSSERFRPRYAVDIVILTPDLEPDPAFPPYTAVPLPVPLGSGQESGSFAFPQPGSLVVVGFVYGRQDHPVIRQVYALGASLPEVKPGEWMQQQSPAVFQKADVDGNWTRATDAGIVDASISRAVKAVESTTDLAREVKRVSENSLVEIGGMATIEVGGLLTLLAGLRADLGTLGDMHLTAGANSTHSTAGQATETVGKDHASTVKGNRTIQITGSQAVSISRSQAVSVKKNHALTVRGTSTEKITGPKNIQAASITLNAIGGTLTMQGKDGVNFFTELLGCLDQIKAALDALASHDHPNTGTITQGGAVASHSGQAGAHQAAIRGITA